MARTTQINRRIAEEKRLAKMAMEMEMGKEVVKRATCDLASGGLYLQPNASTTLTSLSPFTITWDSTCLSDSPSSIDIYLYNPAHGLVHAWLAVPYSSGTYTDSLDASWWNSTAKTSLQLSIVDSDTPRFLTNSPSGPVWNVDLSAETLASATSAEGKTAAASGTGIATVTATSTGASGAIIITTQTASSTTASGDNESIFQTVGLTNGHGGLTKGGLAAAILVPILVVAVGIAVFVKFARAKEAEKRKRWSEHVDKRMSTLSKDWREGALPGEKRSSVFSTGGGAGGAGGRQSFAGSEKRNTRASSFMGGAPMDKVRTNSSYGIENNMAGAGAGGQRIPRIPVASYQENANPEMRQTGQGSRGSILAHNASALSLPDGVPASAAIANRSNRVSFAEGNAAPRMSRISFGDGLSLRPVQSNVSTGGVAPYITTAGANSSRSLGTPERRSMDTIDNADEFAASPSQSQGPFAYADKDINNFGTAAAAKTGLKVATKSTAGKLLGALTGANKREEEERNVLARQRTKEEAVENWKQAEATRRSNDGIRDMEATLLRRSKVLSSYSTKSASSPAANTQSVYDGYNQDDDDNVEELSAPKVVEPKGGAKASPMGMALPAAGLNPDELLAAYAAARARGTNVGQSIEDASPAPATHLRPVSTVSNNPFRASMAESELSMWSSADAAAAASAAGSTPPHVAGNNNDEAGVAK